MRLTLLMISLLSSLSASLMAADDAVIFSDDFTMLDPGWGNANEQLSIAGGKLIIKPVPTKSYDALYQGTTFNDVDIRVKMVQTEGAGDESGGIDFWATDTDHVYSALITSDGSFAVTRYNAGKWLYPVNWQKPDGIKKGLNQVNELRVVLKGRQATVSINDKQITSFKGFPPDGGSEIGVHAESGTKVYTWAFSDFVASKPQ
jgi:hypothetical protein